MFAGYVILDRKRKRKIRNGQDPSLEKDLRIVEPKAYDQGSIQNGSLAGLLCHQSPATSPAPTGNHKSLSSMQELHVLEREVNNKSAAGWSGVTATGATGVTGTTTDTGDVTGPSERGHRLAVSERSVAVTMSDASSYSSHGRVDGFGTPPNSPGFQVLSRPASAGTEEVRFAQRGHHVHPETKAEVEQEIFELGPPGIPTTEEGTRSRSSATGSQLQRKTSKTSNASSFPSLYAKEPRRPPPVPDMPLSLQQNAAKYEMPRDIKEFERRLPPSAFARMQQWRAAYGAGAAVGAGADGGTAGGSDRPGGGDGSGGVEQMGGVEVIRVGSVSRQMAGDGVVSPVSVGAYSQIPTTGRRYEFDDGDSERSNFLRI